jgi:hypothetical protein
MVVSELTLPADWRTFENAASELGTTYQKLRHYVYYRSLPYRRVGNVAVIRMSTLEGYKVRPKRKQVIRNA